MRLGVIKEEPKTSKQFIFTEKLVEISKKHEEKEKTEEEKLYERAVKKNE